MSSTSEAIHPGRRPRLWSVLRQSLRWLRDLWAMAGIALLLLLIVNLAAGWFFSRFREQVGRDFVARPAFLKAAPTTDQSSLRELAIDISNTHDNPFEAHASRWEPYVYWRGKTYSGSRVHIGTDGLRRTCNVSISADSPRQRVFCFGGSTMWGSGVADEGTIPSLLASELGTMGIAAEVTNFGQPGYVSTQEVLTLLLRLQKEDTPDLVVFYDGFNDAGAGLLNLETGLAADEYERPIEYELFRRPKLIELVQLYARHMPVTRLLLPNFKDSLVQRTNERTGKEPLEMIAIRVAQRYLRNIQTAQMLADGFGFEAIYCWQPLVATRRVPAESEKPFMKEGMNGYHLALVDLMQQIQSQISASDRSVHRLSLLHSIFDDQEHAGQAYFFDDCHLGERGNRVVAARIASIVEPALRERVLKKAKISP